jgi:hypothetical protein
MNKQILRCFLFIFLAIYIPFQSMGWGVLGHRIVGEIADKYLTKKTRIEIQKILGNESLAMSSNWADFIKSDSSYDYLDTWHYVNFKKGLTLEQMKAQLKTDTSVNAYTKINFLVSELKKKSLPKDKKQMYLRLLVHFIGDIHQPLHVSPEGTTGGNDIKLNWFSTPSNLHRVWDSHLIDFQQLSYTEHVKAINFVDNARKSKWQHQPISEWLYESYTLAQNLHNEISGPNPRLGYEYNFKHIATLNEQLLKGGVRLAGLLNSIFDK